VSRSAPRWNLPSLGPARKEDAARRGSAFDSSFHEQDRVQVRLGPTEVAVGVILAKPAISRPLYTVRLEDGRDVEASWFSIHHAR